MTRQTACQIIAFVGALISGLGTFSSSPAISLAGVALAGVGALGAYYFGQTETNQKQRESDAIQLELKNKLEAFQANFEAKNELLFRALNISEGVWKSVEMRNVPQGVADYLVLLFTSDVGRISGYVRIKGSKTLSPFSTTANNQIPVAVPNLWSSAEQQYVVPTILEFSINEYTEPNASLSIYTQGWIDRRGQEPHQSYALPSRR